VSLRFGTDGVRGHADELTDDLVRALGRAAAAVLAPERIVLGRDTRISGPRLRDALAVGFLEAGVDVIDLGVAPTPAVAWAAADLGVPGAVISASHNPYHDNGIKLFGAGGTKLDDDTEAALEGALLDAVSAGDPTPSLDDLRHSLISDHTLLERYRSSLIDSLDGRDLTGLHLIIDCANGAASETARSIFEAAGCTLGIIGADPDGTNINAGCGSTHPDDLREAVVAAGADLGLAFDGDADRVVAVDEQGELVDGDHIIAMCATDRHERGTLAGGVVVTVMTNLGLRLAMAERGIEVVEVPVGDRHVLAALDERGFTLGGEQSGHVIFRDLATTGDGVLCGLQIADLVARTGDALSSLAATSMRRLPQVLINVPVAERHPAIAEEMAESAEAESSQLGDEGRVLIRASGTEPLVRVMVEAPSESRAAAVAGRLADEVHRRFGEPA
jgi:phosphoglucosamine mutase